MCGRYTLAVELDELTERFGCPKVELVFKPRYNVAPADTMPVITGSDGNRSLKMMSWGMVPFWAEDRSIGYKMINARVETAAQKPSFREAYRHRRCLVPATGFYEWLQAGKVKYPYYIRVPERKIFAFAGLWEQWGATEQEKLWSFTILTTEPAAAIAHLHDRMPLILPRGEEALWLSGEKPPFPEQNLEFYEVPNLVNRPANDLPACIQPVELGR